jgi:hypothetical protein
MARKISSGLVGEPSVGGINVSPSAVISTAENRDITLGPLGTGSVVFTNNAVLNAQNDLRFADADSSNYVAIEAPATIAANYTLTLPNSDGSNNQVLTTNGTGTLSWTTAAVTITDNTTDSATHYPAITTATSGSITSARVTSTKFTFQPSTGTLDVTGTVRSLRTENIKTASHTLELADRDRVVAFNGTSAQTVTVPLNSAVAFPVGSVVYINKVNTGSLALAAEGGVTLTKTGTFAANEELYIRKRSTDAWIVVDSPGTLTATGGSISNAAGYKIHSFTSVGSTTFEAS